MPLDAGSVYVTLGARFTGAPAFAKFGAEMEAAGAKMRVAEAQMAASGKRIAGIGKKFNQGFANAVGVSPAVVGIAGLGVAIGATLKTAADFEKSMRNVNSIAKLSEPAFKELSKSVLQLSGKTAQAPKTLSEGLYQLVSSGFDAKDSMTILASTSKAATAGLTDTETATTAVAGALNAYHLKASDAAHVSDLLFQTVNRGVITFPALAQTIGTVLPFAASLHVGLNQVGASISTLTKEGIPAAEATTYLKNAMVQFLKPSDALSAAIDKTGASSGEALVKQKGFQGALEAVAKTTDGTKGALQAMFPDIRASAAVFALTGKNIKTAEGDLRGFNDAAVNGVTDQVFKEQSKSVEFQVQQLKANLSVLGVNLGTALLPVLNEATRAASKFIDEMNKGTGSGGNFLKGAKSNLDDFLGLMTGAGRALLSVLKVASALDKALGGIGWDTDGFSRMLDGIDTFREKLRKPAGVTVKVDDAIRAIDSVNKKGIKPKIAKILADGDTTVKHKIAQLVALGIPVKKARIIAEGVPQTLADISAVSAALGALPGAAQRSAAAVAQIINSAKPLSTTRPKSTRAAGRGPGGSETALVGEGNGPELVGNAGDGWQWVTQPTVMSLTPSDSVIPTDPQYSGRALGLMMQAFGIQGYAAGRWGRPVTPGHAASAHRSLGVPARVEYGAVSEDELSGSRDNARESYQKRKGRVHDLDVDIRDQKRKVSQAKAGKARRKAQAKLTELQRDRHHYNDGGDGLSSLSAMHKRYTDLNHQVSVLHKYNLDIDRLNTLQETDRTRMATASRQGNAGAWGSAKAAREAVLKALRTKYAAALKLAKPGSNFAADLEGKLAGIQGDIADNDAETLELTPAQQAVQDALDRLSETGMTDDERAALGAIDRDAALAGLTADLGDDQDAANRKAAYLTAILGRVMADPGARGGDSAITDIAGQLKQARDNVASFTGGATNDNADLQAQLDQANAATAVAQRESQINSRALSTFQGWNGGQPQVVQNVYTLHPGDPATLTAIGDAAVAGMSYQATQPSPRTNLGL